ncbi:hypothetical protein WA026_002128 [Henosepilachna vigintioctopunctata]|uniref:Beta-galactosidase n=1 Tax=Henosepilachna vigintioctopunctata TaxID=420089 RepID=A0AAW1TZZ1_9CUCU
MAMALSAGIASATLPTLYEYYTSPEIKSGLSADQSYFQLNEKNITLYSGAMHYFRVPKQYWRDRLKKMRAAGLNTVETYVPWNLHEPEDNKYDFGKEGSEMQDFLDIQEFLKMAKEEDLFAIVRPGPFICAEFEFGGLPSWLLRTKDIKVRTTDSKFMNYVTRYFNILLPLLTMLQFTKGGPIIAFQVENEYGNTAWSEFTPQKEYLQQLVKLYKDNKLVELFFTADTPSKGGDKGTLPELLQTATFDNYATKEFDIMNSLQTNRPTMVMELWTGWYDHWTEEHNTRTNDHFHKVYEEILTYPASVNMYMFHGGTSFGFLNGANVGDRKSDNSNYQPDISSYDYDAPLSECGDYTDKYWIAKELIEKYNTVKTKLPEPPKVTEKLKYPEIPIVEEMSLNDIVSKIDAIPSEDVIPMEQLPINGNSGQSYGYILYRKKGINISANSVLTIKGHVHDSVVVLVNGKRLTNPLNEPKDLDKFGFWRMEDSTLNLGDEDLKDATLDLLVQNWGRVNFGLLYQFNQFKGLWNGDIMLNNDKIISWEIFPLEFKKSWNNALDNWKTVSDLGHGPSMYRATLNVNEPKDTFIDMADWTNGCVMVNGFVLGRYSRLGPQQALYLPAPFLNKGDNKIIVFENYVPSSTIKFTDQMYFKTAGNNAIMLNTNFNIYFSCFVSFIICILQFNI